MMDLAGNFRGACKRHRNTTVKCIKYRQTKQNSHTCSCGCPAFEHVSYEINKYQKGKSLLESVRDFWTFTSPVILRLDFFLILLDFL
jgi:hypothetical protein